MSPGLDLYYTDPAQHLRTAGYDLEDLDRDLSDVRIVLLRLREGPGTQGMAYFWLRQEGQVFVRGTFSRRGILTRKSVRLSIVLQPNIGSSVILAAGARRQTCRYPRRR